MKEGGLIIFLGVLGPSGPLHLCHWPPALTCACQTEESSQKLQLQQKSPVGFGHLYTNNLPYYSIFQFLSIHNDH